MRYRRRTRPTVLAITVTTLVLGPLSAALGSQAPRHRRPGCGSFCRQAGGLGGGATSGPVKIRKQTLKMTSDGVVYMNATCTKRRHDCGSAILLVPQKAPELGRSDFVVRAGQTRKVGVSLTDRGIAYVRKHGVVKPVFAVIIPRGGAVSVSDALTVEK